jgi:rfaE bifunctional protein nucleotidyltransferase chain/domain
MTLEEVLQFLAAQRQEKTLTLVTGVFDILHEEHMKFLQKAKQLGELLVIGIESDVRVRAMKGADRPVHPQQQRVKNLEELHIADAVFVLPESFSKPIDHENLIAQIKPNFLAISSHTKHQEEKQRILQKYGGELVIVHKYNPDISTTKIILQANSF